MAATSHTIDRPRSLVSHLKNLTGVEPVTVRGFVESSCDAARERLGIRPARVKRTRKTTREGRHIIVKVTDPVTGEKREMHARRRKPIRVYHYTAEQVGQILKEAKPRKPEYKEIKAAALATLAAPPVKPRRLPRHKKWSKRRHRR